MAARKPNPQKHEKGKTVCRKSEKMPKWDRNEIRQNDLGQNNRASIAIYAACRATALLWQSDLFLVFANFAFLAAIPSPLRLRLRARLRL
jgi:hypothetical protein